MGEHFKGLSVDYKEALVDAHEQRWAYGHCDIIAAAYALDPEYVSHDHASNEEVTTGLLNVVEKFGIMFEVRAQNKKDGRYTEMWKKRAKLIAADPRKQQTLEHYPKYPTAADANVKAFCTRVNIQLALYRGKKGIFSREWVFDAAEGMPAYMWWDQYGGSVPDLQAVARIVLAQPGCLGLHLRAHKLRVCFCEGPPPQQAQPREGQQAGCLVPQPAPQEAHEHARLQRDRRCVDCRRGSLGCQQVRPG